MDFDFNTAGARPHLSKTATPVHDATAGRTTVSTGTSPFPSPTLSAASSAGAAAAALWKKGPEEPAAGTAEDDGSEGPHSARKIAVAQATTSNPDAETALQKAVDLGSVAEWEELVKQLSAPVPKLEGWLSSQPSRVQGIFAHKGHADQLVTAYRLIKLRKMHRQQRVLHTPAGRSSFTFEEKLRRFNSIELLDELALDDSLEGDV